MKLSTESYKGTRDLYPEDKQLQNYIFDTWKKTSENFGFNEYGAPLLEKIEIYEAKSGEELVNDQTYTFTDRGDRRVAIRPEMTPTISRMVAAKRQELSYPARLYSIANFMRYERPQKGREREFWQLNADIFGDDTKYADLEIIMLSYQVMKNFGAEDSMFEVKINDRRFITALIENYLKIDQQTGYRLTKLFDQKDKLTKEAYEEMLRDLIKNEDKISKILDLTNGISAEIKELPEYKAVTELVEEAKKLGVSNCRFDLFLMRGLDYYTGTVIEVFDTDESNRRSLFGGGRYDGLVSAFGVEPISAVGVAPGASTCLEFLKGHNLLPKYINSVNYLIASIGETEVDALKLAKSLRSKNLNVDLDLTDRKLDKKIKSADKKGVRQVIIVGEDEVKNQAYIVKNLETGAEQKLKADDIK